MRVGRGDPAWSGAPDLVDRRLTEGRTVRIVILAGLIVTLGSACRGGPPPRAAAPVQEMNLDNTRWWLRFNEGREDGRIVEIKKGEGGEYACTLVNPGKILSTIRGFKAGEPYCKVSKVGPGKYEGTYLTRFLDGTEKWRPVTFYPTPGVMRWSESDSSWERLP
jgi:hypothetical protein